MIRIFLLLTLGLTAATFSCTGMTVTSLDCEHQENPLGVDAPQPRLSWVLQSSQRGDRQTAYQILVASREALLNKDSGDVWDSGKVISDDTIQIPFAGKPLKSSQQVFWKVRAWDASGKVSRWSSPATWTMGILNEADWQAKWIAAPTNAQRFCSGASSR